MNALANFKFNDDDIGVGPFFIPVETPEHLKGSLQHEFTFRGQKMIVYHTKKMTPEKAAIIQERTELTFDWVPEKTS